MNNELTIKTFINISYNALAKFIAIFMQFLANIVLSRNLSAGDYGVVGFAFVFVDFLKRFDDFGINSAVIQKRKIDLMGLHTAFTIKSALGIILFIISFIIAPLASFFFHNITVINVIRLLSLNFIINIFTFIPNSLLRRELNFKKLSIAEICSKIINSFLAIILAIIGLKYWSIVIANLFATSILALTLNIFRPAKIKIYFDKQLAKEFINYGWKLFATGIIIFMLFNADNFIIGSLKGAEMLGYYIIAFTWGSMICTILSNIVHDVLFPTLSRFQGEKEKIKGYYLKILEYISFIAILINLNFIFVSKEFLFHILGHGSEKWLVSQNTLQILCIYGIIRALLEPVGNVIMAVGKTELLLKANMIAAIMEITCIYPAVIYFNIEGAAIIVTIAYLSQYFIYFPFLRKEFDLNFYEIMGTLKNAIISSFVFIPVYIIYVHYSYNNNIILLIKKISIGIFSYIFVFGFITKWKVFKEARSIIRVAKVK